MSRLKVTLFVVAAAVLAADCHADLIGYQSLDSAVGLSFGAPDSGTNDASIVAGGKFGNALQTDGAGDFASVDDVSGLTGKLGTSAKTVSIWFNQVDGTTGLRSTMSLGANGNGTKFDLDIDNVNSGLELGVGGGRTADSGAVLNNGNWHLLVVTHGASATIGGSSIYFDGAGRAVSGTRAINTNDTRWVLGTAANVGTTSGNPSLQFFNGLLDDAAIWDEVLTLEEITALQFVGDSSLGYSANLFDSMKQVHDAGAGSVNINGQDWVYASGIASNTTSSVIFGAGGTGLVWSSVPEPTAAGLLLSLTLALGLNRRRK